MSKLIDMTGKTINSWYVLERAKNDNSGQAQWLCKCLKCNETIQIVKGGNLRQGRSKACSKCRIKKMAQTNFKDETNKTYGFLYVERKATKEESPRDDRIYWNCSCLNCGAKNVIVYGDYLRNGDTRSCGCIKTSYNEKKIATYFQNLQFNFTEEYTFNDLMGEGNKLKFDFAIFNKNILLYLLEFDGSQHFFYNPSKNTWNNEENFKKTRKRDLIKNKYCFDNNIPLIRIPYDADYTIDDLKLETTRFLLTPENEKEYYESRKNI